ncbi:succinylglutamate desuccinylase [Vibrio sp.]|nr:succinylglutamate desuccinylase [Vibrio sp.]
MSSKRFILDKVLGKQVWNEGEVVVEHDLTIFQHYRGVIEFIPENIMGHVILSCGVHGDETLPIEWLDSLVEALYKGEMKLHYRLLIIFAHPKAIDDNVRFVDFNLNRLFSDTIIDVEEQKQMAANSGQGHELKIVRKLKEVVADFYMNSDDDKRWHLDLHCSIRPSVYRQFSILPFSETSHHHNEFIELLNTAGIEAHVFSRKPSGTFSWFTHDVYQSNSVTLELGELHPIGENNLNQLELFDKVIRSWLEDGEIKKHHASHDEVKVAHTQLSNLSLNNSPSLNSHSSLNNRPSLKIPYFIVDKVITKQSEEFNFTFSDQAVNFTLIEKNSIYGYDGESVLQTGKSPLYIIFPNPSVEVGQRAGLLLKQSEITINEKGTIVIDKLWW